MPFPTAAAEIVILSSRPRVRTYGKIRFRGLPIRPDGSGRAGRTGPAPSLNNLKVNAKSLHGLRAFGCMAP